jgi:hypothetical protein
MNTPHDQALPLWFNWHKMDLVFIYFFATAQLIIENHWLYKGLLIVAKALQQGGQAVSKHLSLLCSLRASPYLRVPIRGTSGSWIHPTGSGRYGRCRAHLFYLRTRQDYGVYTAPNIGRELLFLLAEGTMCKASCTLASLLLTLLLNLILPMVAAMAESKGPMAWGSQRSS